MNADLVTSKCQCKRQDKLVKARTRTTAQLFNKSELARAKLEITRSRCANKAIDVLNSHPDNTWVVNQRGVFGGKHDLCNLIVNIVTSMLVNPISMNKTEAWRSVNQGANNQESQYLFKTCVELMNMTKNKSKKGIVTYKLHPKFLAQLAIKPGPRKFEKVQYWYLTCDNVLLVTAEEHEAEYHTQMSALALSAKRKHNEDA